MKLWHLSIPKHVQLVSLKTWNSPTILSTFCWFNRITKATTASNWQGLSWINPTITPLWRRSKTSLILCRNEASRNSTSRLSQVKQTIYARIPFSWHWNWRIALSHRRDKTWSRRQRPSIWSMLCPFDKSTVINSSRDYSDANSCHISTNVFNKSNKVIFTEKMRNTVPSSSSSNTFPLALMPALSAKFVK